jgi:aminopeptidase-like protein
MNFEEFKKLENKSNIGSEMFELMKSLFPICRSITGNGVRTSFDIIKNIINLEIKEIPTDTPVFDWTVPKEWNITDAYIADLHGNKIIDFKNSNLHVVSYSEPIKKIISLDELKKHIHTIPEKPDTIPYLTTYYNQDWGFCMSHNDFLNLNDSEYEILIDSKLDKGSMSIGEYYIRGETSDEFLISCYICHPSMCNDNLSGVVLTTILAKYLSNQKLKYSYRFLFVPETIGSITWISLNENNLSKIKHGLVATCLGDSGISTYKKTKYGDSEIDKTVEFVLKNSDSEYNILDFFPTGSDERQFGSPAFNLNVGSLMRTPYGKFSQYHTSDDDLHFVKSDYLFDSFLKYLKTIFIIENNRKYVSLNPKCEPQFGKRGLYRNLGGQKNKQDAELAMFWVMSFSDGQNDLIDISEKSKLSFELILETTKKLVSHKLLEEYHD